MTLVVNVVKPFEDSRCIFPLVEFKVGGDILVNSIKDLLANFTDFRFCGIDKAASRDICEVGFMVLQGNEGVSLSSDINSVIEV